MRATAKTSVSFGLVSLPVKIYTATSPNKVRFNMLSPDKNRVSQKLVDSVTGKEVDRKETISGYEYTKDKYVTFSSEEIEQLKGSVSTSDCMEILEFVNAKQLSRIHVEKSYYLGPDKGGEKAFALLSKALENENVVGLAKWCTRGKEHLVAIRPCKNGGLRGLVMEQLFYNEEVRDFSEVGVSDADLSDEELDLASQLIATKKSNDFDLSKYKDEYAHQLMAAVDAKISGKEVVMPASAPKRHVVDLFDALKASLKKETG